MAQVADHRLYLLFTPELCRNEPWQTLRAALRGGIDLVQWRSKRTDDTGTTHCLDICMAAGVPLIINDDVELAVRLGAAGAHVGQDDMATAAARRILGHDRWLGVSTHEAAQIERAVADGADHLGFGPMYPTATKGYDKGQPKGALAAALGLARVPVFAIGGIDVTRVDALRAEGCSRIAISSAVLHAPDPERAAAELRDALDA